MAIRDPFDEAREQRIDAIRTALKQKNPGLMREALQLALAEYPADQDVQDFRQQLAQLEHASNVAKTLIKHGRRKVASGDCDAGIAKIRQALQMEPENRNFQSALFDALTESATFAVEQDADRAWQLLQEATELSPLNLRLGSIRVHIVDRIREQKVLACLTGVEELRANGRFREAVKMVAATSRQLQPHRVPALEIVRHELLDELGIEPRKRTVKPAVETAPVVETETSAQSPGWNSLEKLRDAWQRTNIREPLADTRKKLGVSWRRSKAWASEEWIALFQTKSQEKATPSDVDSAPPNTGEAPAKSPVWSRESLDTVRQRMAGAMHQSVAWARSGWNNLAQMKSWSAIWAAVDQRCRAAWQSVATLQQADGRWTRARALISRSPMAYPIAAGVACVVLVFATAMIGRSTDSKPKLVRVGTGSMLLPVTLLQTPAANGEVAGSLNAGQHVDILKRIPERTLDAWTLVRATGDPATVGYVRLQNLDKVQTEDQGFDLWVATSFLNRTTSSAEFRARLQQLDQRLNENPPPSSRDLDQTYLEVSKAYARVAAESAGNPKELEATRVALANSQNYLKRIDGALQISEDADAVQSSIQRSRAAIEKKPAPVKVRSTAPSRNTGPSRSTATARRTAPAAKLNEQTRIMRLANNAYSQKIYETAAMYCSQVLKINPNNKEARKLLATVRREQVELEASIIRQ